MASRYASFPVLLEAYRECLRDVFDMPALMETLSAVQNRSIRVHVTDSRTPSPFAGALRQRLALRAAAACVKMARLREDAAGLRDAEHLAPGAGTTQTSLAGRVPVAPLRVPPNAARRLDPANRG